MATEQQIETVAKAIRLAFLRQQGGVRTRDWKDIPEKLRESFKLEAAAAIEAYETSRAA